jgi:hypothetical protein
MAVGMTLGDWLRLLAANGCRVQRNRTPKATMATLFSLMQTPVACLEQAMYEVFFEQRGIIPPGRYCEVAFEELEADPVGEMRRVYRKLELPDFAVVEPNLEQYVRSLAGYRKNRYPDLAGDARRQIARSWKRCFDEWGYSLGGVSQ